LNFFTQAARSAADSSAQRLYLAFAGRALARFALSRRSA
jgi:hypothetical protein